MTIKKFIFVICTISITYFVIEGCSYGLYRYLYGTSFSFSAIEKEQAELIETKPELHKEKEREGSGSFNAFSLHPYLGFVHTSTFYDPNLTKYGFLAEQDPIAASADPKNAIVAITGASVSEFFFQDEGARKTLHTYLDNLQKFKDKKVIICTLGMASFAQPQQLLSVLYYLFQGGRLDMLINLDGRNETWNYKANSLNKSYLLYPVYWNNLLNTNSNPDALSSLGQTAMWKNIRQASARAFQRVDFSVTLSTIWSLLDKYLTTLAVDAEKAMVVNSGIKTPYFISGADTLNNISPEDLTTFSINAWVNGSTELYQLSKEHHFDYFHFLQPNQYVPNSKTFSDEEKISAYDPEKIESKTAIALLPQFEALLPSLRKKGINVKSLTSIYKDTKETIYIDVCCHVNALGNEIMANAIGKVITEHYAH